MFKRVVVMLLSVSIAYAGLVSTASAAVVGTQQALSVDARQAMITHINSSLQRDDVRQAMIDLGVDPQQAEQRVASLTDQELAELDGKLDQLPAGSGALAVIGIVFLVLLILDVTGVINIFSGT